MDELIRDYYSQLMPEKFRGCESRTPGSYSCVDCFKKQYFYRNIISYDCEEKRKLYLLRYFHVHQAENYRGSSRIPSDLFDRWFGNGFVKILSIGGGPGSDICGILTCLQDETDRRNVALNVLVTQVDVEGRWGDIFDDVMERLFPWCDDYRKVRLDVEGGLSSISDCDFNIVSVSYLVSELGGDACLKLADDINSALVDGGVLIINDRPEDVVGENIRSMLKRIGMNYEEGLLNSWAGYRYPNEISNVVMPKFNMSSIIFIGVKR